MNETENPMVRDECWPEYDEYDDDESYWDWIDNQTDQARGK